MITHKKLNAAVIHASYKGNLALVRKLVLSGADIHTEKDRPVTSAGMFEHFDVVKFLLKSGANVQASDNYLLRSHARSGRIEMVKFFLNAGADVHVNNDEPLTLAAMRGHAEVAAQLLDAGGSLKVLFSAPIASHRLLLLLAAAYPELDPGHISQELDMFDALNLSAAQKTEIWITNHPSQKNTTKHMLRQHFKC